MRRKSRNLYDVGVNDADYQVQIFNYWKDESGHWNRKIKWVCPFYSVWKSMLQRIYSKKYQASKPTYKSCTLCDDWIYFSNFKAWMETQDWEGKCLDKDILVRGNKHYSPEMCVFVSKAVNSFVTDNKAARGKYPIGVDFNKQSKKFVGRISNPITKESEYLGLFDTPEEAHAAWLEKKLEFAKTLAKEQDDPRVAEALIKRYENYKEK